MTRPRIAQEPDGSEPFSPAIAQAIDLDQPLRDLRFGQAPAGAMYGSLLALIRLHESPLAIVELPLEDGSISASELAEGIHRQASTAIEAHIDSHRCVPAGSLDEDGLLQGIPGESCRARVTDSVSAPFITVVVPTVGGSDRIARCIDSLTSLAYPDYEILIVDNRPEDPATRRLIEERARQDRRIRYAAEPKPGSSMARNRGIPESSAEIVAFTDDDIEVDPQWLSWMAEHFVADEQVGVVTGLVMPMSLETSAQRWFEESSGFGKGLEARRFDLGPNRADDRLLYPFWGAAFGSGGSMAFRRSVLIGIDGFDPALGTGSPALAGADIESFSHAILQGSRLVYEPRAVCWHNHRATEAAVARQTFTYAVGFTAIMTKWILRERRLLPRIVRELARIAVGPLRGRANPGATPHELERLGKQLRMHRSRRSVARQFWGYALGPFLYARSALWVRRLGLRKALQSAIAAGKGA